MSATQLPAVAKTGYQNFGSFFTENVEDIIRQDDATYRPPPHPFSPPDVSSLTADTPLGAGMRPHFFIDFNTWNFINHGAFGGVLRPAMTVREPSVVFACVYAAPPVPAVVTSLSHNPSSLSLHAGIQPVA